MSNREAAAAITAEREAFERAMKQSWQMVDPLRPPNAGSYWRGEHEGICAALKTVRDNFERALSAPVAPQPAASGVDALWVDEDRFRHRFEHWCTGGDSRNLPAIERRSSTGAYKLMQTQSDWVAWLAAREALSTALTGEKK
jgi:hypothetical protein